MTKPVALQLLTWLSPAYPVGAYAYSHGVEWAVEAGDIRCRETLFGWLVDVMRHGAGRNDAICFRAAYHAAVDDMQQLIAIVELASAFAPSRERKFETLQQGDAFMVATLAAWPCEALIRASNAIGEGVAYPVAVSVAAAAHRIPLTSALEAYLLAFAANLVSAAVRAIPLGQTDGQRVIARIAPVAQEIARDAEHLSLDDLGGAALRSDLASMHHETQYTRLFRS